MLHFSAVSSNTNTGCVLAEPMIVVVPAASPLIDFAVVLQVQCSFYQYLQLRTISRPKTQSSFFHFFLRIVDCFFQLHKWKPTQQTSRSQTQRGASILITITQKSHHSTQCHKRKSLLFQLWIYATNHKRKKAKPTPPYANPE
jgi:hypothetical protein